DPPRRRLGAAIAQLVDPPVLAQRLLHPSSELLGVTRGAVSLREGEPQLYRLVGSLGPTPALTELSSGCPLIEAVETGQALLAQPRLGLAVGPAPRQLPFLGGAVAYRLVHEG